MTLIYRFWLATKAFYDASDAAMFLVYSSCVAALLGVYTALLTASFDYVDSHAAILLVCFVAATVLATIHAIRHRKDKS